MIGAIFQGIGDSIQGFTNIGVSLVERENVAAEIELGHEQTELAGEQLEAMAEQNAAELAYKIEKDKAIKKGIYVGSIAVIGIIFGLIIMKRIGVGPSLLFLTISGLTAFLVYTNLNKTE